MEHTRLIYRSEEMPESRVYNILDLLDIKRLLAKKDLGRLHATGRLENAVFFNEPDAGDEALEQGGGEE